MQMILASTNRGKYREMKAQLEPLGIELLFGGDFERPLEVDETGESYAENALLKARAWAEATGLPALADDSGLEAEALEESPGYIRHVSSRAATGTVCTGCSER